MTDDLAFVIFRMPSHKEETVSLSVYPPNRYCYGVSWQITGRIHTKAFSMEESKMSLITNNQTLSVSSSEIAEMVEKRHDNVKRTIETLVSRNIIASPQIEEKPTAGRTSTDYIFEGEKGKRDSIVVVAQLSPEFTARLVDRWMELEGQIKPKTQAEILLGHAQHLVDLERKQLALQKQQDETKAQVKALVDGEDYFTVVGYLNLIGERMSQRETAEMGKAVTAHCRANGIRMGKSKHPNFGLVNSYPHETLEEVYTNLNK